MSGMKVIQPGLLTLIQDGGRYGHHRIGLTTGGPLDMPAFRWANRLCENDPYATALEVSIGGLVLESQLNTTIAVCGADLPLKINGQEQPLWQSIYLREGDRIELGYAASGTRAYLAVAGGFDIEESFSSTATVTREGVGGLDGQKLQAGTFLPCKASLTNTLWKLAEPDRPLYGTDTPLRVVLGYQHWAFDAIQTRLFFSSEYELTDKADRMGFRLAGQPVKSSLDGILSEGICHGAIQIPADGQPIVLLNDRQTIGGYPKIGSVIAQDTARLSQLMPGAKLHFEEISLEEAHNLICLSEYKYQNSELVSLS